MPEGKPNILVIWGDDIGITNLSCYGLGVLGYRTPNIDRIATEGMLFTDAYGEQSCTAGRASFITGQSGYRTGLTKVGIPAAKVGLQAEDPIIAELRNLRRTRLGSSARTILATATNTSQRFIVSTSSPATCITSMLRKTPKETRIRGNRRRARTSARCDGVGGRRDPRSPNESHVHCRRTARAGAQGS